ncbi:Auxin-responsive protein IAA10 [Cocos nucifera]|uniref:Auxin-responsive protein n=1 Tax=Cocos nucifera TaxID=13894 RepID=A0A8K0IID4_COCNU|nr:Auxin-responsive protein IAA10 [Cocos nucifera]
MKGVSGFDEGAASAGSTSAADVVVVEKDYVGLSEAASSHHAAEEEDADARDEREEEEDLELGLSLGAKKVAGGGGGKAAPWGQCCRILTAKDFPSLVSRESPRSSSTSSVSSPSAALGGGVSGGGGVAGTKRAADTVCPDVVGSGHQPSSQVVVGWPPIRAFRMNSLFNQSKDNTSQTDAAAPKKTNSNDTNMKEAKGTNDQAHNGRAAVSSRFVKVNMDGDPIGRKVDLNAHQSYETLALSLELMFHKPTMALGKTALMQSICVCKIKAEVMSLSFGNIGMDGNLIWSKWMMADGAKASKLLDGSSEFALTYEDRDGDWMLVGDVPWRMFLDTVKRLRIMRTSDASGLVHQMHVFCNLCASLSMNGSENMALALLEVLNLAIFSD